MGRTTIGFGIDLGTTNSAIALLKGTNTEVIPNVEGISYTPSAVWMNKNNTSHVGARAKQMMISDAERGNVFGEFKGQMGKGTEYRFARSGLTMKPEELSAEVLKALKADVQRRTGEEIDAAVITVPAAFDLPQCDATRKAAQLAGLSTSPLLQEPVAAALAYGFQDESEKALWLVYDLGGGTFDAAIMQVRNGIVQVVNHGGDNYLGGKLIDWEIVEQLLVPALLKEHDLPDFHRSNDRWYAAFGKLKHFAEEAKIRLSQHEVTDISIDRLCDNAPVDFECELKRSDVERIAEPFIVQSINICRKVLAEKRLRAGDIEKVILVGGPTQMPYLRERLLDGNRGLGISLAFNHNPLTVVACGAAIFAGTQRVEQRLVKPRRGTYAVVLEYSPVGSDPEPLVGGVVVPSEDGEGLAGFSVEIVNTESKPQWRSGKVSLDANGRFMTSLWAEKGRENMFRIELYDPTGTKREITPDQFPYQIGLTIQDVPLTHSVGVALADNETEVFLKKGVSLPAKKRGTPLRTAVLCRAGHRDDVIKIPVVEGESRYSDRNRLIGTLEIPATDPRIRRDVPIGSEVEVTLHIDESRIVTTRAYIPILDEEFEGVHKLKKPGISHEELEKAREQQKRRLEDVRKKADQTSDLRAREVLQRVEEENIEHEIDASFAAAPADRDAADKCESRILALKMAIDEIEDALEWPMLLAKAQAEIADLKKLVNDSKHADSQDRYSAEELEKETLKAIEFRDVDLLKRRISEVISLWIRIAQKDPGYWTWWFSKLKTEKATLRDQNQAEQLFVQGDRAINSNDLPGLRSAVQQLWALMPEPVREQIERGYGGGLQR